MDLSAPNLEESQTGIEVTLIAIDGENLVLESIDDKIKFLWPLDKIPRPLEIGCRLTLALQKGSPTVVLSSKIRTKTIDMDHPKNKDERMRKLLEELVN